MGGLEQGGRIESAKQRENERMKKILLALVACSLLGLPEVTKAVVLDFDDITTETLAAIPDGYEGLNWDEFITVSSSHASGVFSHGVESPSYVAACGSVHAGTVSHDTLTFDFESVYMTAGWTSTLDVITQGYLGETLVYEETNTVSTSGPVKFDFNWTGIDELVFIPDGGAGSNKDILLDDLSIRVVPEPASTLVVLVGGSIIGLVRRFYNQPN